MEQNAPRIIFEEVQANGKTWCWRPEWCCGSDSIYGLLAKFGSLNALQPRDLGELFVVRNSEAQRRAQPGRPYFPIVDLRYTHNFHVVRFSNLLRLDVERVQLSFVDTLYPNSVQAASPDLVWCSECAMYGFHSPTFQLNYSSVCPAHGKALIRRCPRCKNTLPYALKPSGKSAFFFCAHCGKDFAPELRMAGHAANIDDIASRMFASHTELIRFNDQLSTMISDCKTQVGRPHMPLFISKPDLLRRGVNFRQFVSDVLTSVKQRVEGQHQDSLAPLNPTFTFRDFASDPRVVVTKKRKAKGKLPSPVKSPVVDQKFEEAWTVYRSVRRNILHHHVCEHRRCIEHAMKTLWWNLEGERTQAFCSVALAFIRWRMQWEGKRIPAQLDDAKRRGNLYGLVGWISKDAPMFTENWSKEYESWINAHLLAVACIDSFVEWIRISEHDTAKGSVRWLLNDHEHFLTRHWACSGRGNRFEPGQLYVELPAVGSIANYRPRCSKNHWRGTLSSLATIKR